jgi:histidinol-phosphate aminotransferase
LITAKEPTKAFLEQYLTPSIFSARGYHIDTLEAQVKLDQNESPWDWPDAVKDRILAKLKSRPWNRYPPAFGDELAVKIANKIGVSKQNILLGPGSNYLIGLVLQTFSKKIHGKVVLARPSFALYESHCQYEGIPYEAWPLNEQLEYDLKLMPELPPGSMVLFASPNNPVGNILPRSTLRELLKSRPDVLFIGDEAYCEFADEPYTELLQDFPNLILIRTFSKTLGAAGVRLGYILAGANVIDLLKKPRVPFLINQFTLVAAGEVLEDPAMAKIFDDIVKNAIAERKRVCASLESEGQRLGFKIKSSQANFLLARWSNTEASNNAYQHLIKSGILVRNVAAAPGLAGCLRISIGTSSENDKLLSAFSAMIR